MFQPNVTILIRSMLRPELDQAIASIEAQTYQDIQIHVVNASGKPIDHSLVHSKLPLTFFQPKEPLKRAAAATAVLAVCLPLASAADPLNDACPDAHVVGTLPWTLTEPEAPTARPTASLERGTERTTDTVGADMGHIVAETPRSPTVHAVVTGGSPALLGSLGPPSPPGEERREHTPGFPGAPGGPIQEENT